MGPLFKMILLLMAYVLLVHSAKVPKLHHSNFPVCPSTHPFAFSHGDKCCKVKTVDWASDNCGAASVPCSEDRCEDHYVACYGSNLAITVSNFSAIVDGTYVYDYKNGFLEANRPVYQNKDKPGQCLWWHRQYRHWWITHCSDVGINGGAGYLDEDRTCPFEAGTWKRGGLDTVVDAVVTHFIDTSSSETQLIKQRVANVNARILDGKYQQLCKFNYVEGKLICKEEPE